LEATALQVTLRADGEARADEVELTLETPLGDKAESRTYRGGRLDGATLVASASATITPLELNEVTVSLRGSGDGGPDGDGGDGADGRDGADGGDAGD